MNGTVLVIDDEAHIREVVVAALEALTECTVLSASSGESGQVMALQHQPDMILLDVMMPELDGPATLACLKALPATAHIPVIFLTAKVQQSDIDNYRSLGVAGVVPKPFDPMRLPHLIQQALGTVTA